MFLNQSIQYLMSIGEHPIGEEEGRGVERVWGVCQLSKEHWDGIELRGSGGQGAACVRVSEGGGKSE